MWSKCVFDCFVWRNQCAIIAPHSPRRRWMGSVKHRFAVLIMMMIMLRESDWWPATAFAERKWKVRPPVCRDYLYCGQDNICYIYIVTMQFEASSHLLRASLMDVRLSIDPKGGRDGYLHRQRKVVADSGGHHHHQSSVWGSPGFLKRGLRRWGSTGSWVGIFFSRDVFISLRGQNDQLILIVFIWFYGIDINSRKQVLKALTHPKWNIRINLYCIHIVYNYLY